MAFIRSVCKIKQKLKSNMNDSIWILDPIFVSATHQTSDQQQIEKYAVTHCLTSSCFVGAEQTPLDITGGWMRHTLQFGRQRDRTIQQVSRVHTALLYCNCVSYLVIIDRKNRCDIHLSVNSSGRIHVFLSSTLIHFFVVFSSLFFQSLFRNGLNGLQMATTSISHKVPNFSFIVYFLPFRYFSPPFASVSNHYPKSFCHLQYEVPLLKKWQRAMKWTHAYVNNIK